MYMHLLLITDHTIERGRVTPVFDAVSSLEVNESKVTFPSDLLAIYSLIQQQNTV